MPRWFDTRSPDFDRAFAAFRNEKRETSAEVDAAVAEIIAAVRAKGDAALVEYTERFDHCSVSPQTLAVSKDEIAQARALVDPSARAALERAAERIRAYHERQKPTDALWQDSLGVTLGWRWSPIRAVGLYVPGGTANYPSSVLMNAIPARVAGVERLEMACPTPRGEIAPLVILAAELAGVDRIWRIGGAQAIAAFAYGTETIAPVDKIVGPGNAFVAAAKRQVFGTVGIDTIAGPSEVVVVGDGSASPEWLALDLLAQAEHDPAAQAILITPDPAEAQAVAEAVERWLEALPRAAIAEASWRDFGAVILVRDLSEAARLCNALAPEHLQLCVSAPEALLEQIRNAGAIFLGSLTPEAMGDYSAGPNHVLPTARTARFASGLSVLDFMKRTTIAGMTAGALRVLGPDAICLAEAEGLSAHAESVRVRLRDRGMA